MEITPQTPHMGVVFPAFDNADMFRSAVAYAKVPNEDLIVLCNLVETDTEGWFEIAWSLKRPTAEHDMDYYLNQACNQLSEQKEALGGEFLSQETIALIFKDAPLGVLKTTFAGFLKLEAAL